MQQLTASATAIIRHLAFSPDGTRLAAACDKVNARVWDLASGAPVVPLKGMKNLDFVGFTADPDALLLSAWNTPVLRWDLRTHTARPLGPKPTYCRDAIVSPDGTRVVRAEGPIVCRDAATGRTVWSVNWDQRPSFPTCVRYAGGRLVVVSHRVSVHDADTGKELGGFDTPLDKYGFFETTAVSPDGRWLAVRWSDGLWVCDTTDGRLVLNEPTMLYGKALAFTPNGGRLAVGRSLRIRGEIDSWEVGTWRRMPAKNPGVGTVLAVTFSADGRRAAAGGFDGQVAVWTLRGR